jgi:hypothetical protein
MKREVFEQILKPTDGVNEVLSEHTSLIDKNLNSNETHGTNSYTISATDDTDSTSNPMDRYLNGTT